METGHEVLGKFGAGGGRRHRSVRLLEVRYVVLGHVKIPHSIYTEDASEVLWPSVLPPYPHHDPQDAWSDLRE